MAYVASNAVNCLGVCAVRGRSTAGRIMLLNISATNGPVRVYVYRVIHDLWTLLQEVMY
jgi:hypothetical protein